VTKRPSLAAAALLCVLAIVGGCAGASNSGGDTTCKDFLAASDADQGATVAKMLKERNGRNGSTTDVEAKRAALVAVCAPSDKRDAKIGDLA
jgi:acid stress chaperone HdeA